MDEKKVLKLADNGRRFIAGLIDYAVPIIFSVIMFTSFGQLFGSIALYDSYYYDYDYGYGHGGHHPVMSIGIIGLMVVISIVYVVVEIYFYSKSQSIGKAIMGLKVVRAKDGESLGIWMMLLREFIVKRASKVVFWLGFIWIFIDKKHRAWHDLILETYVIDCKNEKKPEPVQLEVSVPQPAKAATEAKVSDAMETADAVEASVETSETATDAMEIASEAVEASDETLFSENINQEQEV